MATLQQIDQTTPYPDGSFGDDAFDAFRKTNENMLALQKAADLSSVSLNSNQSIYWDGNTFVGYSVSPAARAVLAAADAAAMRTAMGAVGNVGNENIFGAKTFTENNAIRSRAPGAGVWLESTAAGTTTGFMLNASGDILTLNLRELNFGAQRSSVFQVRLTDFRIGLPLIPFSANTMTIGTAATSFSNVFTNELTVNGSAAQKAASLASIGGASATALAAEATARADADSALGLRIVGKNRIINGDFRIWQRGTTFNTVGYCADRWFFNVGNIPGTKIERNLLGPADTGSTPSEYKELPNITIGNNDSAAAHYCVLEHRVENVHTLSGKKATISMVVYCLPAQAGRAIALEMQQSFGTGGSPQITGIGTKKFVLAAGFNKIVHTVDIPSTVGKTVGTNDSLVLTIWLSAGTNWNSRSSSLGPQPGNTYVTAVQLEEGAIATDFDQRPLAYEMLLCQRYFRKSFPFGETPANNSLTCIHRPAVSFAATAMRVGIDFPAPMRVPPSLSFFMGAEVSSGVAGRWGYYNPAAGSWFSSTNVPSVVQLTNTGFTVDIEGSGLASPSAYIITGQYTADAEI